MTASRIRGAGTSLSAQAITPPSVWIDNAFQRRLATPLERALVDRSRHVIGAVSGAGKTTGAIALERRHHFNDRRNPAASVLLGVVILLSSHHSTTPVQSTLPTAARCIPAASSNAA